MTVTTYTLELTADEMVENFEEADMLLEAEGLAEMPVEVPRDWDHQWLINRDAPNAHPISSISGLAGKLVKLDGIETGAQANVIERISVNGTNQIPTDKAVDIFVLTRYRVNLILEEQGRIFLKDPLGNTLSMVDTGRERILKSGH